MKIKRVEHIAVAVHSLKQSIDLSIGVFGQSFLTGEPQRLMQEFVDRKR